MTKPWTVILLSDYREPRCALVAPSDNRAEIVFICPCGNIERVLAMPPGPDHEIVLLAARLFTGDRPRVTCLKCGAISDG